MEQYKAKLKIDTIVTAILAVILLSVSILAFANEFGHTELFTPTTGDSHWHARWNGFISGASIGLTVFMIISLIRNLRAMKSEAALKKLYVKVNDERTEEIIKSAQAAAYRAALYIGLVAVIVAGYFSIAVSLTILGCIWILALLGIAYKFNFNKKI